MQLRRLGLLGFARVSQWFTYVGHWFASFHRLVTNTVSTLYCSAFLGGLLYTCCRTCSSSRIHCNSPQGWARSYFAGCTTVGKHSQSVKCTRSHSTRWMLCANTQMENIGVCHALSSISTRDPFPYKSIGRSSQTTNTWEHFSNPKWLFNA